MIGATKVSLDTNILIYAVDSSQGSKHVVAGKILLRAAAAKQSLMLQSLNEFSAIVSRKQLLSLPALNRSIEFHRSAFVIEPPAIEDLFEAVKAQEEHKLAFWDALLWASVRRTGCRVLFSEDFPDGGEIGGVRFINPFRLSRGELQNLVS